jgi:hypothetical protein
MGTNLVVLFFVGRCQTWYGMFCFVACLDSLRADGPATRVRWPKAWYGTGMVPRYVLEKDVWT